MRDGQTRRLRQTRTEPEPATAPSRLDARVVLVSGPAAGQAFAVDRPRLTLGRGPGVDVAFNDAAMSRQHAAVERTAAGFRVIDLGSTNGIRVNDRPIQVADIEHGDRFSLGTLTFQLLVEANEPEPETYELPSEV